MMKSVLFAAAFVCAVGPVSIPVSANVVLQPVPVLTSDLPGALLQTPSLPLTFEANTGQATTTLALVEPGSQSREVRVLGRSLSLSLMRADRMGLAVLSVPKRSVIPSLPELELDVFRSLVADESGCEPVGQVRVVGSRAGTVALATGLSCS